MPAKARRLPFPIGTPVHAGLRAESGAWIGSECRFVGTAGPLVPGRTPTARYVNLTSGPPATFLEANMHPVAECPRQPVTRAKGSR